MSVLKCALISDTHYGYDKNTRRVHERFFEGLSEENLDVLFWAGDIGSSKPEHVEKSFAMARRYLPNVQIIAVLGNHDLWSGKPYAIPPSEDTFSYRSFYTARSKLPITKKPLRYPYLLERINKAALQNGIELLDAGEWWISGKVVVLGMGGWYKECNLAALQTNDYKFLPETIDGAPTHVYLSYKAERDLGKLLDVDPEEATVVMLTHFPPFTEHPVYERYCANLKFMDFMTEKADYLLVGHSHKECDFVHNGCRVLNCGSDYNKPKYKLFEIEID
jgi:predicted phosphodiesterase